MKEMLFIMIAILIPPTLTYLGIAGDGHARRMAFGWQRQAAMHRAADAYPAVERCWPNSGGNSPSPTVGP